MSTFAYLRVWQGVDTDSNTARAALAAVHPDRTFIDTIDSSHTRLTQLDAFMTHTIDTAQPRRDEPVRVVVWELWHMGRNLARVTHNLAILLTLGCNVQVLHSDHAPGDFWLNLDPPSVAVGLLDEARARMASTRIRLGQQAAREHGQTLGRPVKLTDTERNQVRAAVTAGQPYRTVAQTFGVSEATISRIVRARIPHGSDDQSTPEKDAADGQTQPSGRPVLDDTGGPVERNQQRDSGEHR